MVQLVLHTKTSTLINNAYSIIYLLVMQSIINKWPLIKTNWKKTNKKSSICFKQWIAKAKFQNVSVVELQYFSSRISVSPFISAEIFIEITTVKTF